jgi:hypothetical protein
VNRVPGPPYLEMGEKGDRSKEKHLLGYSESLLRGISSTKTSFEKVFNKSNCHFQCLHLSRLILRIMRPVPIKLFTDIIY